jgi:hypothetical protein
MISKTKICLLISFEGLNKDAEDYFVSNMLRVDGNYTIHPPDPIRLFCFYLCVMHEKVRMIFQHGLFFSRVVQPTCPNLSKNMRFALESVPENWRGTIW